MLTPYFREEVIALLPDGPWEIPVNQVHAWLASWDKSALDCILSGVLHDQQLRRG